MSPNPFLYYKRSKRYYFSLRQIFHLITPCLVDPGEHELTRKLLQVKVAEIDENHRMSSPYQDLIFGVFKTGQISC